MQIGFVPDTPPKVAGIDDMRDMILCPCLKREERRVGVRGAIEKSECRLPTGDEIVHDLRQVIGGDGQKGQPGDAKLPFEKPEERHVIRPVVGQEKVNRGPLRTLPVHKFSITEEDHSFSHYSNIGAAGDGVRSPCEAGRTRLANRGW